jgi:hypothetical protein
MSPLLPFRRPSRDDAAIDATLTEAAVDRERALALAAMADEALAALDRARAALDPEAKLAHADAVKPSND